MINIIIITVGPLAVTFCKVSVDGSIGYGFFIGDSLERAFCIAIITAVLTGEHHLKDGIREQLYKLNQISYISNLELTPRNQFENLL